MSSLLIVREYRNGRALCMCGCEQETRLAPQTRRDRGWVRGEPMRFVHGHTLTPGNVQRGCRLQPPHYIVDDNGCWIWQHATTSGYGSLGRGPHGQHRYAHRKYYEEARGPIPEGLQLDHLCRVPACVNPDHLEPVTQAENLRRGRGAKLTADQVRLLRRQPNVREAFRLADEFGISRSHAEKLYRYRKHWVGVEPVAA